MGQTCASDLPPAISTSLIWSSLVVDLHRETEPKFVVDFGLHSSRSLPLEAFDVAVLARPNEVQMHAVLVGPEVHRLACELGPVIDGDRLWSASQRNNLVQSDRHLFPTEGVVGEQRQANLLYRSEGNGTFRNVAPELNLFSGDHATPSTRGDYDNDGRPDLYVSSYIVRPLNEHDHMYHNAGDHFSEVIPWEMLRNGATHGIQWVDFDGNGALDLATCNNNPEGHYSLWRNLIPPERAQRSLQVMVLDKNGHATKPGAEVRIFEAGTRTILGTRIIDTGGGYCSQNIMPVHFGLPKEGPSGCRGYIVHRFRSTKDRS